MKNILIIGAMHLPLPSVKGGAIEGLVDEFLKYNSKKEKFKITVYSPFSKEINDEYLKTYNNTNFRYIHNNSISRIINKIKYKVIRVIRKNEKIPTSYALTIIDDLKRKKELDKYDLVIIENQVESLIEYRKKIKSKIVEHLHNDYINNNTKSAKKIVESCDEFWGVSNFICNQIKKIDKNAVTKTLYNGVDIKKFREKICNQDKEKMYNKIGFEKNDFIILFVGRIMPEKGVLELIKAFNNIKNNKDNMKLLIVGEKKSNSDKINAYMNELIEEQSKNKEAIYFYGKANENDLKTIYSIANLQVVPSICEEAFGLIIIEGMCANNFLIVSNSGGIPEIVEDKAIIVNKQKIIKELEQSIVNVHNNSYNMKKNTKDYAKIIEKYSIDNYNANFESLILDAISEK